jgi:hypothetical protein
LFLRSCHRPRPLLENSNAACRLRSYV